MESLLEYQRWTKTALDYSLIPNQNMVEGIKRYVEHGVSPGGFLTALLSNDLTEAMSAADSTNRKFLVWTTDENGDDLPPAWVKWLIWDVPGELCGSPSKVTLHCKKMTTRTA
tara:strand:- start:1524 stop:1862 length:339 start_codon:yes stop_codon:yes gene_type:complete